MSKREQLCLKLRNRKGQENETYCKHYIKHRGGYMKFLFCNFKSTGMFLFGVVMTLVCVFATETMAEMFYVPLIIGTVSWFFWIAMIIKGLWYWKYTRHVFMTDEGIWVMSCSVFWWKGAPDFTGKRRFLAPSWSLYSWDELKNVSSAAEPGVTLSKIYKLFEEFDRFLQKSKKYKSIYMARWDGVEEVNFLLSSDAEEILSYAKAQKQNSRKKSKEQPEPDEITSEESDKERNVSGFQKMN